MSSFDIISRNYSENPDYYLDFKGDWNNDEYKGKFKPTKNPKLHDLQNMLRSKTPGAGKLYWRTKTDKHAMDFGIAEELILTDKLDVGKYVKRIILEKYYNNDRIIKLINKKYPQIEVIEIDRSGGKGIRYADVKRKSKEKEKEKELIYQENKKEP